MYSARNQVHSIQYINNPFMPSYAYQSPYIISNNNTPFHEYNNSNNNNNHNMKLKNKAVTLYKTESCRNWTELGHCRYGKKCRYAHGSEELRAVSRHVRYKTQICRAYHMDGSCPYGIRCTFVHESDKQFQDRRNSLGSQDESSCSSTSSTEPYNYLIVKQQEKQFVETVYYKNTSTMRTNNNLMLM